MIAFLTLISSLCSQPGVGHGRDGYNENIKAVSNQLRNEAFAAQSSCTKRLFKACTSAHVITKQLSPKDASCLVENL